MVSKVVATAAKVVAMTMVVKVGGGDRVNFPQDGAARGAAHYSK